MSAFLDITDAVVASLVAAPALASGHVQRGRLVPLPADKAQGIFVRPLRAPGEQPFASDTRAEWDFDIAVAMAARAAAGSDGMAAIDTLLSAVYARLVAAPAPPAADGWTVQPQIAWDFDEADTTLGAAELRLRVRLRTATGSLAADT